jgi:uncharacterized membrane protein YhaH (DUF805 family)
MSALATALPPTKSWSNSNSQRASRPELCRQAMKDLLFNPNGRIAKRRFWQGVVLVTVVAVIKRGMEIKLPGAMDNGLGIIALLLTVGLVYANICIFAKRFHDAGTSGWWIIAVWFAKFFTFIIMFALFGGLFLGSDGTALLEAVMEGWATADEAQLTQASRRLVDLLFPLIILSYVVNGVLAALVVGSLPSDPAANIHGRPPGDGPETFN